MKNIKERLMKIPKSPGVYPHTKQSGFISNSLKNEKIVKSLEKINSLKKHSVGVYFFKNTKGEIIYIGKAVNLKARVKSYFSQKLYGLKAVMMPEIVKIDYKITDTEIDALILESQHIKKHLPKYNVMLKDDKNYFYVVVTGDKFPKILITHQTSKFQILGPYTDGAALKTTLRFLRKIFPYCTCQTKHKLPCLKAHLGLCLGVCCTYSTNNLQLTTYNQLIKTYNKNIKSIIDILSGKKKGILAKLQKEMKKTAEEENFEKAAEARNKIIALKNIFEHKIETKTETQNFSKAIGELSKIFESKISRIEFYDISNIQGQLATGSMVVFDGGKINKNEYRKFKIKTVLDANDPAMMKEVLMRRLKHTEWPMPDLIIVDGGITQLDAAKKVFQNPPAQIKCASLAKNPDRLFISPLKAIALKEMPQDLNLLLQNLRDEAHRFAIGYHRKLRSNKLKSEFR